MWFRMNSLPGQLRAFVPRHRGLLRVLALLIGVVGELIGQGNAPEASKSPAIRAHFEAAQEAQERSDYATAEREYRAVLAVAPLFAEGHMNLGLVHQLQNRIPEAMADFRRALAIKPALAGANFFLGVDHCKMGEETKAIPYLRAATRQEPKRADIWMWLATAQEMSGEIEAEVATLRHALTLEPGNVDLLYLSGHAYERLGKKQVGGLQKAAPGSSWAQQLLAESYSKSNEWSFAVIRFQNAIATSPIRPGLHVGLGEVLLRAGRLKPAAKEIEEELRIDQHSLRALVRRGEVKLIQGDVEGALEDWSQAIGVDEARAERILGIRESGFGDAAFEQLPDVLRAKVESFASQLEAINSPAAHFALAFLATQDGNPANSTATSSTDFARKTEPQTCVQGEVRAALQEERYTEATHCFRRLLNAHSSLDLRLEVAHALFENGDYDGSLAVLGELPASDRRSPPAFYWRARCYEKLATAAYLRLYQVDTNSYRLHQLMGDLEAARNDDKKAMEEYRAAIALKPTVPNLHYSLGHLLWKNLQTGESRTEFEKELELNPRHVGALHDLGNTYLLEHQPEKAVEYLKRALAIDPSDPDLHRDLGTGYTELRDYRRAESEFKIALSGDRDGSVHYKLGRVYQALGEKDKAEREFSISTAMNRESHSKLEKQTDRLNQIEGSSQNP
jgi:tetratricopeptide (TPR) repeat protein